MTQTTENNNDARPGKFPMSVRTRISVADYEKLVEAADIAGMSIGQFARHRLSGAHISSKIDVQILNELRRQGGLAKRLAMEGHDTSAVLAEIIKTVRAVQASM